LITGALDLYNPVRDSQLRYSQPLIFVETGSSNAKVEIGPCGFNVSKSLGKKPKVLIVASSAYIKDKRVGRELQWKNWWCLVTRRMRRINAG
jgi:hypothetical protein